MIRITEKNVGNWCFYGYVCAAMILALIVNEVYRSNFAELRGILDGLSRFFAGYVGFYNVIDVSMSGSSIYKAMLSAHIIFSPAFYLFFLPLRIKTVIFRFEKLIWHITLLLAISFIFFYGPISDFPDSKNRRYYSLMGFNYISFSLAISTITALISIALFAVFMTLKTSLIKEKMHGK